MSLIMRGDGTYAVVYRADWREKCKEGRYIFELDGWIDGVEGKQS